MGEIATAKKWCISLESSTISACTYTCVRVAVCTCNVRMYTCYNSLPNYRRDDVLVGPSDRSVCTPDMCGDDGSTRL